MKWLYFIHYVVRAGVGGWEGIDNTSFPSAIFPEVYKGVLGSIFLLFFPKEDFSIVNIPLFVCELLPQHGHWQMSGVGPHLGTEPRPPKLSTLNLTARPLGLARA